MEIIGKERDLLFARIEGKTPVFRPALQLNQSSLWGLGSNRDQGGEKPDGQIVSIESIADGRR